MNGLTEIEKQYAATMLSNIGLSFDKNQRISDSVWWVKAVRESVKKVAYHEAGHFAARLFTRLELSHVVKISIIGNAKVAGYISSERNFTELDLKSYPPPLQRSHGKMLLLKNLAGYAAEKLLDKSENFENIFDYYECVYGDEWDADKGSDFYKAFQVAEIMAKPYMPVQRILKLADKWTLEMLRMPAVWNFVETVAGKLIEQGEIMTGGIDDIMDECCADFSSVYHLTKWRRRLFYKPGELDEFIERA
jgi:hypothetical protein